MKPYIFVVASLGTLALGPTAAHAQQAQPAEKSYFEQRVTAPSNAFELTLASGYTQGFGMLQSGVGLPSVAGPGLGLDLGAGYRIDPHWGVSIGGQYQEMTSRNTSTAARGLAMTVAAQYHIDPNVRLDPWLELGTGYRMLWSVAPEGQPNVLTHGFELARARVGFDMRVSQDVALSPVIGADATVFTWQDAGNSVAISSPTLSTFVFAGVQGRIDIGGTKVGTTTVTSAEPERTPGVDD